MRRVKITCISIIFFISNYGAFGQVNDSTVMYNKSIDWSLFRGIPNTDTLGARISINIQLETDRVNIWNGVIQFKAYAVMNPLKSWVRVEYRDTYTLQH